MCVCVCVYVCVCVWTYMYIKGECICTCVSADHVRERGSANICVPVCSPRREKNRVCVSVHLCLCGDVLPSRNQVKCYSLEHLKHLHKHLHFTCIQCYIFTFSY